MDNKRGGEYASMIDYSSISTPHIDECVKKIFGIEKNFLNG